mmetsp:Transcript_106876/g.212221  ORF Transcript_106876/g.212221 Transcript_106876/m.212221 type:complete len:434 (+) Transcript_106876:47-1348(+)
MQRLCQFSGTRACHRAAVAATVLDRRPTWEACTRCAGQQSLAQAWSHRREQTRTFPSAAVATLTVAGSLLIAEERRRGISSDVGGGSTTTNASARAGFAQIGSNAPCEDRHCIEGLSSGALGVAVIDGHGGWQVAEYLRGHLLQVIAAELDKVDAKLDEVQRMQAALEAGFADCEAALLRQVDQVGLSSPVIDRVARIGACALCAVISPNHLFLANAGDCQACLVRSGEPVFLHAVHNANQLLEQQRLSATHPGEPDAFICKGGGINSALGSLSGFAQILKGGQASMPRPKACYVKGCLQPTRSFGDFYLKYERFGAAAFISPPHSFPYITAIPEVVTVDRTATDEVLVLASDGLWDYLEGADVARIVKESLGCQSDEQSPETAKMLANALADAVLGAAAHEYGMDKAFLKVMPQGSRRRRLIDDITVVVVLL